MTDCFISYSNHDQRLAEFVHSELRNHGVAAFMASASLQPGQHWSEEILTNLRNSKLVILLASRAACASAFVNQEIGGAVLASKQLVPIVWDMNPTELPGWARQVQAIDLRGATMPDLRAKVAGIAGRMKQEQMQMLLIAGAVLFGLLVLASSK